MTTNSQFANSEAAPEPVAWVEHHKGGDNLNWEPVNHAYAKATPLYAHPPAERVAVLEGLLLEALPHVGCSILMGAETDLDERIHAALEAK